MTSVPFQLRTSISNLLGTKFELLHSRMMWKHILDLTLHATTIAISNHRLADFKAFVVFSIFDIRICLRTWGIAWWLLRLRSEPSVSLAIYQIAQTIKNCNFSCNAALAHSQEFVELALANMLNLASSLALLWNRGSCSKKRKLRRMCNNFRHGISSHGYNEKILFQIRPSVSTW